MESNKNSMSSPEWKTKRAPYEFSKETKTSALKRSHFSCEECGTHKLDTEEKFLEIHHIVKIAFVIRHLPQLAPELFNTLENCKVLCIPCHEKLHRRETNAMYEMLAQSLLGLADSVGV